MTEQEPRGGEKFDEKADEKALEKRDEKSPQEKSWDEKWRRDPLGAIIWAMIFIWAGLVLLASNLGYLDAWIERAEELPGWIGSLESAWPIILVGAGVIFLFEVLIRLLVPEYRRSVMGTFIFAIILIGIGLGDLVNWGIIWAVILIGVGLAIIFRGLGRREG